MPDGLTITVGVGASLFDSRYGLAARKPAKLVPMPQFPNDNMVDSTEMHGDLSIQICADNRDTVMHALRDITKHTRGGMALRWKMEGYNSPPRPSGTSRNLLGFKDGTANPTGLMLSAAMLLRWLGERHQLREFLHAAASVEAAADAAMLDPGSRTADLGGSAKTQVFTKAVIRARRE